MKLDGLLSVAKVARFLGTREDTVTELLEEGRLSGALVAVLRNRGIAPTPNVKKSIDEVVRTLSPNHGMQTLELDRADLLSSDATVTIVFTDIVGSTSMTERLGDRRAQELLRIHNEIVRRNTAENGGVEVKSMGDGFMLTFQSARRAVAATIGIQRELAEYNSEHPEAPILVRSGMSVGEPIREEQDLFGKSVILAARVSSKAEGGQILVCQIVYALVNATGEFEFNEVGQFELKGITDTYTLYEVLWRQQ